MLPPLSWTVADVGGHLVVSVRGALTTAEAARLRMRLLKCLAEQPAVLVVDISAMTVVQPVALSVFTAVVRQAATWPGIPVLLCAPAPDTAELIERGGYGAIPVVGTVEEAFSRAEARSSGLLMVTDDLLPIRGAARHARDMVTDACLRWSLPHLLGPGMVIAGELVANAIDHAGTMMTLRLSLRPRHLHIAVRDGATEPPAPLQPPFRPGSGLALVDASATHWGWMAATGGKVVWAVLSRTDPAE